LAPRSFSASEYLKPAWEAMTLPTTPVQARTDLVGPVLFKNVACLAGLDEPGPLGRIGLGQQHGERNRFLRRGSLGCDGGGAIGHGQQIAGDLGAAGRENHVGDETGSQ
jgi:hypothetical protein